MAGEIVSVSFDDARLQRYLSSMHKGMKSSVKRAFSAGNRVIINATKKHVRASHYKLDNLAKNAVRGGAWRSAEGASTYIRGPQDYRQKKGTAAYNNYLMLFFEGGTDYRVVKMRTIRGYRIKLRRTANRGFIQPTYALQKAVSGSMQKAVAKIEESLKKAIQRYEQGKS